MSDKLIHTTTREPATSKPKKQKPKRKPPANILDNFKCNANGTRLFNKTTDKETLKNKTLPIGTMNNYFYSANLQPKATYETQNRYIQEQYKQLGTQGLPKELAEQAEILDIYQQWYLAQNALLFADGASGIYRALTCHNRYFKGFETLSTSKNQVDKFIIYASLDQVKKCFFGACVNEYGNFKKGVKETLQRNRILKELADAIIGSPDGKSTGREPQLHIYDARRNWLGSYKPIIFDGYSYDWDGYKILLDPRFFNLKVDNNETLKTNTRYIPTINGLLSICTIGRAKLAKKYKGLSLPNATTATKVIHTLQASFNCQTLVGIDLYNDKTGKQKIRLNKQALGELFPRTLNPRTGYIDYKKAGEQMGLIGEIVYTGLEAVGALDDLITCNETKQILLPSVDKSCYFDPKYKKAVFINCQRPLDALRGTDKKGLEDLREKHREKTLFD